MDAVYIDLSIAVIIALIINQRIHSPTPTIANNMPWFVWNFTKGDFL